MHDIVYCHKKLNKNKSANSWNRKFQGGLLYFCLISLTSFFFFFPLGLVWSDLMFIYAVAQKMFTNIQALVDSCFIRVCCLGTLLLTNVFISPPFRLHVWVHPERRAEGPNYLWETCRPWNQVMAHILFIISILIPYPDCWTMEITIKLQGHLLIFE